MHLPSSLQTRYRRLRRRLDGGRTVPVARQVIADRLTYLEDVALEELFDAVAKAEHERREGILVEAGCALGGSAIVMASAKAEAREFRVYDVFGMPPGPSAGDGPDVHRRYEEIASGRSPGIGGGAYYGYVDDLKTQVEHSFIRYSLDPASKSIRLVEGLLQDTLVLADPVAVAHIDCDRHDSVAVCLDRIAPRLADGGVMIIDDYDSKSGCRKAVDDFLQARGQAFRMVRKARPHIVRR